MTGPAEGDGLAAALIQISAHAERIGGLDAREAAHHSEMESRLRDIATQAASVSARIDGMAGTLARQAAVVDALDGLDGQVAALASRLAELAGAGAGDDEPDALSYLPVPSPPWWKLSGPGHDAAVDRLRAWVERIYRPSYGQLAAMLPPCWEHHPLCLYMLDWLSELWSVLYLGPHRTGGTLAAQAEWQTRLLPAAADQMAYEATGCQHTRGPARGQPPASARTRAQTAPPPR
jgi:hypothetical protein